MEKVDSNSDLYLFLILWKLLLHQKHWKVVIQGWKS